MALLTQPTDEFIECLARRALAIREGFVKDNPIRFMVARVGDHLWFIERAAEWPFEASPYAIGLVHWAMDEVLFNGRDLREACRNLPRVSRGSRGGPLRR